MNLTELQFTWFILIGVLFTVYALLDGFDLGVGMWYLFITKEEDKNLLRTAIGPIWDGNEVWLIAGGGGLLAAFPLVYATVFSSMYLAVMLILWSLIFRALSLEFRNEFNSKIWKGFWDLAFSLGSFLTALLLGIALGNILHGLILDSNHNYAGSFFDLLHPFSIVIGLLAVLFFLTHGATYMLTRTKHELFSFFKKWSIFAWIGYLSIFIISCLLVLTSHDYLFQNFIDTPIFLILPLIEIGVIFGIGYWIIKNQDSLAFTSTSLSVILLFLLAGISMYPNMVFSQNSAYTITIAEAASSDVTLSVMLLIALLGIPIVLLYTYWLYRTFVFEKLSSSH